MSPPPLQATRFDRVQRRLGHQLLGSLRGSWRRRSLVVLALLLGFYAGQNLTALILENWRLRPVVALQLVLVLEVMIRLRSRVLRTDVPLGWILLDNLRIGLVYALVLEAFKLGS